MVHFVGGTEKWSILWGHLRVVHFFEGSEKWSILGIPLRVVLYVFEFNMHDKGNCQIKNAFVFSHKLNGGCTCAVIAVDSTGI